MSTPGFEARTIPGSGSGAAGDPRPRLAATLGPLIEEGIAADEAMARLSALGYRAVAWPGTLAGYRARDLDRSARRGVAASLRRHELALAGIDLWIPPAHFLEAAHADRAVAAAVESLGLAAELAAAPPAGGRPRPTVNLLLPTRAELASDATLVARLDGVVAELARAAGRDGVALADHGADAAERVAAGLAIGLDPVAELAGGRDPAASALRAGASLASARLVDLSRAGLRIPPGEPRESRLDVTAYLAALDVAGYRRELLADARQWRDPLAGLAAVVDRCGEMLAPTGALR